MITPPYRILTYQEFDWLLCLFCNRFSANFTDIQQRYCGYCHVFLDDLPETRRSDNVQGWSPLLPTAKGQYMSIIRGNRYPVGTWRVCQQCREFYTVSKPCPCRQDAAQEKDVLWIARFRRGFLTILKSLCGGRNQC